VWGLEHTVPRVLFVDAAWSKCIPTESRFGVLNLRTALESSVMRENKGLSLTYCLYEVAVLVSTCGRIRLGELSFLYFRTPSVSDTMASMEGRLMDDK
jgi:hypothetical protein